MVKDVKEEAKETVKGSDSVAKEKREDESVENFFLKRFMRVV